MVPFGGRLVVPLFSEHLLIGLGGGGAFVNHLEATVKDDSPNALFREHCGQCESRRGLGSYGLARLEYVFSWERRFGVGAFVRFTRARLDGKFLPRFGSSGEHDQWLQLGGTISLRFR
jgi:hypothetical protein